MDSEFDLTDGREVDRRPPLRRRDGTIREDGYMSAPPPVIYEPTHRDVVAWPLPPPVYAPEPVRAPGPRNPDRASAARNVMRSIWHQLAHVAPWFWGAAVVLWVVARYLTHMTWLAYVLAAIPVVVWLCWMRLVAGQARAHYRGDAVPPPGAYGRYL